MRLRPLSQLSLANALVIVYRYLPRLSSRFLRVRPLFYIRAPPGPRGRDSPRQKINPFRERCTACSTCAGRRGTELGLRVRRLTGTSAPSPERISTRLWENYGKVRLRGCKSTLLYTKNGIVSLPSHPLRRAFSRSRPPFFRIFVQKISKSSAKNKQKAHYL